MGANVSTLVDSLIDAKVQGEVNAQIELLKQIEKATSREDQNRETFVEERGVKVCSELISSPNYEVAMLATRIIGNVALAEENIAKVNAEVDLSDVILQLKVYPQEYCVEALRTIANLCVTEAVQRTVLELGIFAPLLHWIKFDENTELRYQACRVCVKVTENLSVARILISRDTLDIFIKLTNHIDDRIKAASVGVLANMCKGEDTKSALMKHGVVLQFFLIFHETQDVTTRREAMRGAKNFTQLFTNLSGLRFLTSEDMELVSSQTGLALPSIMAKPDLSLTPKFLKRLSVSRMLHRLEHIAILIAKVDRCTIWMVNEKKRVLWTYNRNLTNEEMDKDLSADNVIEIPDHFGIVGECFQRGKRDVVHDVQKDYRFNSKFDENSGYTTRNMMVQPLIDRVTKRPIGVLQVINKRLDARAIKVLYGEDEEAQLEDEEEDDDQGFASMSRKSKETNKKAVVVYTVEDQKQLDVIAAKITPVLPMILDKQRLVAHNLNLAASDRGASVKAFDIDLTALANADIRTVLKTIMAVAKFSLQCDTASFYLHEPQQGILWGVKDDGVSDFKIPTTRGIASQTARDGKVQIIRDCYTHPQFDPSWDKKTGYRTRTMLVVPVKSFRGVKMTTSDAQPRVIGVFQMINKLKGEFNKNDVQRLEELRNLTISIVESKMGELETELNERRSHSTDALKVLVEAIQHKSLYVQLEAIQALRNVTASEINHDALLGRGAIDILIKLSRHQVFAFRQLDKLSLSQQNELHQHALSALAAFSANVRIRSKLVSLGCLELFLGLASSHNSNVRYQALRGIANLATDVSTHERLTARSFIAELQLQAESTITDEVIQVIRTLIQLVSFRKNAPALVENGAWEIVFDALRDADIQHKSEQLKDLLSLLAEASCLFCTHASVREVYLNEKPARKILEQLFDTNITLIQEHVVRHFVYILEDAELHEAFFETGGLDFFDKILENVNQLANAGIPASVYEPLLTNLAEACLEVAKRETSLYKLLDWGILQTLKRFLTVTSIDMMYHTSRIIQIAGLDEASRSRMIEMGIPKLMAPMLKYPNDDTKLEALEALRILCLPSSRRFLPGLESLCNDIVEEIVFLLTAPEIDEPNLVCAIPACQLLHLLCQSPKNRAKIIQTGLLPDVIYLAQDDDDDDALSEDEYDKQFSEYRVKLRELLVMLDDQLPDK